MMLIRLAIRSPLMLIFSFTMAFIMGGKMALIFLVVIPILGIGLFAVIHKVGPLFKRVFRKYDALNNSIQENVKGMRVVKSFVREEYEKENSIMRQKRFVRISPARRRFWRSTAL